MAGFIIKPAIFFTQYHFKQKKRASTICRSSKLGRQDSPFHEKTSCFFLSRAASSLTVPSVKLCPSNATPARIFGSLIRFESRYFILLNIILNKKKELLQFVEALSWVGRIRTCGMTAPKAVVLPLDDDPILYMIS